MVRFHFIPIGDNSKNKTKSHNLIKVGEDLKKFQPLGFAGGDKMVVTAMENSASSCQKLDVQSL